jgi:hypothetical protein
MVLSAMPRSSARMKRMFGRSAAAAIAGMAKAARMERRIVDSGLMKCGFAVRIQPPGELVSPEAEVGGLHGEMPISPQAKEKRMGGAVALRIRPSFSAPSGVAHRSCVPAG